METVTLRYTPPGGTATTTSISAYSVRGFDDPDEGELWPGVQHNKLDGTIKEEISGFRRKITIETAVLDSAADRRAVLYWLRDVNRKLDYKTETQVAVALEDPTGWAGVWEYNTILGRRFIIRCVESTIRTGTFPV